MDEEDEAWWRATEARQIRLMLEQGNLNAGEVLACVAAGDCNAAAALAEEWQLDAGLLWTLAHYALEPSLRAWAKEWTPRLGAFAWTKLTCFICGAEATLAELQGNDQAKHLRCGRCGADWSVPRMQCVHCGNEDHHTLSYLYPQDGRDQWRIQVCDQCRGYQKILTAFSPTPPELVIVEDLAMLHLDVIAANAGYRRNI